MLKKITIQITGVPELRYTFKGLPICTIIAQKQRYVAFDEIATQLVNSVMINSIIEVFGYYKEYKWKNTEGEEQSREDFIIKSWREI